MSAQQAGMDKEIQKIKQARVDAQQLADKILRPLGENPPVPQEAESLFHYEQRLFDKMKQYTPYKDAELSSNETSKLILQEKIYGAADAYLRRPDQPLREVTEEDATGRKISRFYGNPEDCWAPFKQEPRVITGWKQSK